MEISERDLSRALFYGNESSENIEQSIESLIIN